eukprot:TRINITY_DN17_c0_g3_i3.p1 TRINITY_DN17_c0_g3~~TRINITY_DN17_c0_g3_i3.p1  ORF type:complete len:128 (+),score=17.47 TRINITY_DN17_c0_g3_i3:66-449(+)
MAPKKEKAAPAVSSKPAKSGGGGKQKKKKWSKGKQKEKVNNMVLFDQATYDKLLSDVPKYKLITPSVLSDRLRVGHHNLLWLARFFFAHTSPLCRHFTTIWSIVASDVVTIQKHMTTVIHKILPSFN